MLPVQAVNRDAKLRIDLVAKQHTGLLLAANAVLAREQSGQPDVAQPCANVLRRFIESVNTRRICQQADTFAGQSLPRNTLQPVRTGKYPHPDPLPLSNKELPDCSFCGVGKRRSAVDG